MSENPIDRHYHALNCDLEPVDKSTTEFKVRISWIQSEIYLFYPLYIYFLQNWGIIHILNSLWFSVFQLFNIYNYHIILGFPY
jgi:hypothetical protein